MSKFIIENKSDLSDMESLELIRGVVNLGRISNKGKQYCHVSTFEIKDKKYTVTTGLNRYSDRFLVSNL